MIFLPSEGTEKERNNGAPPCDGGSCERREIEEVHEAHMGNPRPHKNGHERSEGQIVQGLKADDLRHDEPRIPHDRPIEHDSSPRSKTLRFLFFAL